MNREPGALLLVRAVLACLRLPWFGPHRTTRPGARPWPSQGYAAAVAYRRQALRVLPGGGRHDDERPPLPSPLPLPPQRGEAVHLSPPTGTWLRRGLAILFLLYLAGTARAQQPAAAPPLRPSTLLLGEQALRHTPLPWPRIARLRCQEAARLQGPYRAEALLCQGRASMLLGWPGEAARLARVALREKHYPPAAYVLLGDALRALGGGMYPCPEEALRAYQDAQRAMPEDGAACTGLRACSAVVPLSCGDETDLAQASQTGGGVQ